MLRRQTSRVAAGCGCFAILVLGVPLIVALLSAFQSARRVAQPTSAQLDVVVDLKYRLIDQRSQRDNVMQLFAQSGPLPESDLREFCRDCKRTSNAGMFYYAVIFDDASNAAFPSDPFSAEFGLEESKLLHIRAIYVYNRINGFSELRYYDTNAWEGRATRIRI